MQNFSDDEHDEDDLPNVSTYVTQLRRPMNNERATPQKTNNDSNLLERFSSNHVNRSLQSWQQLHQKTLRALHDEDEDDDDYDHRDQYQVDDDEDNYQSVPKRVQIPAEPARTVSPPPASVQRLRSPSPLPLPVRRQSPSPPRTSITQRSVILERPPEGDLSSSTYQHQPLDSQKVKSKWEVRLPQLLSVSVGPDRQKLDKTRRHTSEIVYQKANSKADDLYLPSTSTRSNGTAEERPRINPLVKQLKQKFDRLAATSSISRLPTSEIKPPALRRAVSLASRGTTETVPEWSVKPADALLPRRPAQMNVTNTIRARSDSGSSMSSGRSQRGRQGPPVSYRKQFYRPKTTMHMVKELLENRDNLVYDSSHERAGSINQSSLVRSSSSIAQRAAGLTGDNEKVLTGRQLSTQTDDDDYATITPMLKQETIVNQNNDAKKEHYDGKDADDDDEERSERDASRHIPESNRQSVASSENNYYAPFEIKP